VYPLVPAHVPSTLTFRVEVAEALVFEVVLVVFVVVILALVVEVEDDLVEVVAGFEELLLDDDVPQVPESG
jgi:hypothetical protein